MEILQIALFSQASLLVVVVVIGVVVVVFSYDFILYDYVMFPDNKLHL